jgi:hypothetical protein
MSEAQCAKSSGALHAIPAVTQWPTALAAGLLHGFHACLADELRSVILTAETAFGLRLRLRVISLDFHSFFPANGQENRCSAFSHQCVSAACNPNCNPTALLK